MYPPSVLVMVGYSRRMISRMGRVIWASWFGGLLMCLLVCEGRVDQKVVEVVDRSQGLVVSQGFLPLVYITRITHKGGEVKGLGYQPSLSVQTKEKGGLGPPVLVTNPSGGNKWFPTSEYPQSTWRGSQSLHLHPSSPLPHSCGNGG